MPEPMSAQDRLDCLELIARYAKCIDTGDIEGYVANFTPDADIEWVNGAVHGHDEIRAWVGEMISTGQVGGTPAKVRHFTNLPEVSGDSQTAHARTYVILFTLDAANKVTIPFVGSYIDTIVKHEGAWLFQKRIIGADLGGFRANAGRE